MWPFKKKEKKRIEKAKVIIIDVGNRRFVSDAIKVDGKWYSQYECGYILRRFQLLPMGKTSDRPIGTDWKAFVQGWEPLPTELDYLFTGKEIGPDSGS